MTEKKPVPRVIVAYLDWGNEHEEHYVEVPVTRVEWSDDGEHEVLTIIVAPPAT